MAKLNPVTAGYTPAPEDLQQVGKDLWCRTLEAWDLDCTALALLHVACQAADRVAECRSVIARDGVLITDPSGRQRSHPLLPVEKEAANLLLRSWRMLNFSDDEAPKIGRPPVGR